MKYCAKLIELTVAESEIYPIVAEHKAALIYIVGLPLVRTTAHEMESMESNPKEFVNNALDICDQQQSNTIKAQTVKMLEALYDNVDGSLSYAVIQLLQTLAFSVQSNNLEDIPTNFSSLMEVRNSVFLASPQITRIETCILMLSHLYYWLPKRADIKYWQRHSMLIA